MKTMLWAIAILTTVFMTVLLTESPFNNGLLVKDAEAIVGRPLTPISYAGVARRTTRRVIYRTSVYVATLPRGCTTVVVEGVSLHQCGGTYYQPYGNQYVVVNVN
jgi:hypothetical protein